MVFNSSAEAEATIFARVKEHVTGWKNISLEDQLTYIRLSGLSSACYKVSIKDPLAQITPRSVLYRKKSKELTDSE